MNAVLYRANGQIAAVLEGGNETTHAADAQSMGLPYILTTDSVNPFTNYVKDGAVVAMPAKPSEHYVFNYTTELWELTSERAAEINRSIRLELLLDSDWTQLPDSPLNDAKKAEWAMYRQELRDLLMTTDPDAIVWPTKPS